MESATASALTVPRQTRVTGCRDHAAPEPVEVTSYRPPPCRRCPIVRHCCIKGYWLGSGQVVRPKRAKGQGMTCLVVPFGAGYLRPSDVSRRAAELNATVHLDLHCRPPTRGRVGEPESGERSRCCSPANHDACVVSDDLPGRQAGPRRTGIWLPRSSTWTCRSAGRETTQPARSSRGSPRKRPSATPTSSGSGRRASPAE